MTLDTLFGPEKVGEKYPPLRMKVIRPLYESLEISEAAQEYLRQYESLTNSARVAEFFSFLRQESKEHFWSVHLSAKNRILCLDLVSVGSLSAAVVHPREVFKSALLSSASSMLFVHNHPSGETAPSNEDREITRRLKEAGELLGITVIDHLIIGDGYLSFADHGWL
jgi:DNA repair protein RadC